MKKRHMSENNRRNVLILTADAGSGHRSAALAIQAALEERYGEVCHVSIVNPLREAKSPGILHTITEDRYDDLVQNDPGLYELSYRLSDSIATASIIEQVLSILLYETMKQVIRQQQPDVVVSTYPLYLESLYFVFDRLGQTLPLVAVVTDLVSVHTLWFNPKVDLCLVPTAEARLKAIRSGVKRDRIRVSGLPVHPRFAAETRPQPEIRQELGWAQDQPTALIVGGTRVKQVTEIARAIDRAELGIQLAVVAGGDEKLYRTLNNEAWQTPVHLYGFVDNMPALINASDVVITKAGGLIVSETLACRRPIIFSSAIPGQETGNVDYVTGGGAGEWAPSPEAVLQAVTRWFTPDDSVAAAYRSNAERLGRPNAAMDAADLIWKTANTGPSPESRRFSLRSAASLPLKASAQVSRSIDKLEQEVRGVTDAEMARLASWCISQIETITELENVDNNLRERLRKLETR
jgi:1,2-diacylglycerol 3-beta-galactosyltransferase